MAHEILIYAQPPASTGSLRASLRDAFNGRDFLIRFVDANDIKRGALRGNGPKLFVLPGITGENSGYTDQLDPLALSEIRHFVQSGHVMLTVCAGTYFVSRETQYHAPWGQPKGRTAISPLFNGLAKGPIPEYARKPAPESNLSDVTVIPVQWKNAQGKWVDGHVCYGNGPQIIPDDPNDPNMEILARYQNIAGAPIALLRQRVGRGYVYMSGILPEIGHQQLRDQPGVEAARKLMGELYPHEDGRKKMWDTLISRMKRDMSVR